MSRVGDNPVDIPEAVKVSVDGSRVTVEGPGGELTDSFDPNIGIRVEGDEVIVTRPSNQKRFRALHGLTRSLIANMVEGVTDGFHKSLEIHGVGYRATNRGGDLRINVGFSHEVVYEAPDGIELEAETPTLIHVRGVDKQLVGQVAAEIRQIRPPEPYKGKGIRYVGEEVRRKAGKATVGGTGAM